MAGDIDTSTEAVERVQRLLRHPDGVWMAHAQEADEMLGALAAERDRLAAALAQARREGMEAAAKWHDEQAAYCSKRATERMAEGHRSAFGALKTVQATHENSAATIRAKAQEARDE